MTALVLFMNDVGYATCDVKSPGTGRESGGGATERGRTVSGCPGRCSDCC
ncbi:hypothetical protein [Micromonospora echinofusca]|nr:hypothetical protein [Micromonospora echinofusca]